MHVIIFGLSIDVLERDALVRRVTMFLGGSSPRRVATINPEFLLLAEKNSAFREALRTADMRIVDGFGVVLAGLLRGRRIPRFAGADLMKTVLGIAEKNRFPVFFAVNARGLSTFEEIKQATLKLYPRLCIHGADIPPQGPSLPSPFPAPIVFCNFGIPEQELWLEKICQSDSRVRLAMGVGGAFDYLTGRQKRAPRGWSLLGLEWLWRFLHAPKRWKRIWRATVVFPFRVIFATIKQ